VVESNRELADWIAGPFSVPCEAVFPSIAPCTPNERYRPSRRSPDLRITAGGGNVFALGHPVMMEKHAVSLDEAGRSRLSAEERHQNRRELRNQPGTRTHQGSDLCPAATPSVNGGHFGQPRRACGPAPTSVRNIFLDGGGGPERSSAERRGSPDGFWLYGADRATWLMEGSASVGDTLSPAVPPESYPKVDERRRSYSATRKPGDHSSLWNWPNRKDIEISGQSGRCDCPTGWLLPVTADAQEKLSVAPAHASSVCRCPFSPCRRRWNRSSRRTWITGINLLVMTVLKAQRVGPAGKADRFCRGVVRQNHPYFIGAAKLMLLRKEPVRQCPGIGGNI